MLRWREFSPEDGLRLRLVAGPDGVRAIDFEPFRAVEGEADEGDALLDELERQLQAYFAGRLQRFDVPLDPLGTGFQLRVWKQLETIPFGETRSYRQIAEALGTPQAVRAVGAANGANPIPIMIPCHRVIGTSGRLVGYGGGLELKKRLLELEGAWSAGLRF